MTEHRPVPPPADDPADHAARPADATPEPSPEGLVPASWRDDFVMALRLRDVPGAAIGDALAEVEAHCADAGQTAEHAFGPAAGYAASLPYGRGDAVTHALARVLAPVLVLLAGVLLLLAALAADAGRAVVGAGELAILLGAPLGALVLVAVLGRTLGRRHATGWFVAAGVLALAGLVAAAVALADVTLLTLPTAWAAGLGAVGVVTGALATWREVRGDDPVVPPGEQAG